ncbi:MAG: thiolase family protein [Bdellovibrionota bacterium]
MSPQKAVFLCSPKRTAIGSFQGAFASKSAVELGTEVVQSTVKSAGIDPALIQELVFGCVLSAGLGQAPARQVALKAGLAQRTQCMTVNKVCSSGLKAVMLARQSVLVGSAEAVVAGGMESMSQAPYLVPSLRNGARMGHTSAIDTIIKDGLWDVYNDYHMGNAAELCAREHKISREAQDAFAIESYSRALNAILSGHFRDEIVPIAVSDGKAERVVDVDEEPARAKLDKIPHLKPVFIKDGTVTAANASSLNDGAAAMIVCSETFAAKHGLKPLARVVEEGFAAQAPEWFTTAPISAVELLLSRAGKKIEDVDLFEINEAFSAVALACGEGLRIPPEKLNVNGGAVALGHPIGASGARILTTLLYSLQRLNLKVGVAAICNGGGEATALMVERL